MRRNQVAQPNTRLFDEIRRLAAAILAVFIPGAIRQNNARAACAER
jgi:hypothetical protein